MKKSVFALSIIALSLTGCNGNGPREEIHEHTFSETFSHDFDYHWKESTCGHEGFTSEFGEHTFGSDNICTVCGAAKAMISIAKHPESKSIKLGSSVSFEVEVNDDNFVKSYQWQILNLELPDEVEAFKGTNLQSKNNQLGTEFWVDLDCDSARTSKLTIPGPSFYGEKEYRCVVTDIRGNSIATNRCHYTLEDYEESDPYLCVGSYVVVPGETLDLSNTSFGSGTISFNSNCEEITLNNVDFNNEHPDYDPYDSDVGLYFYCYDFQKPTLTVNLVGDNKIDNKFFQEETGAGGVSLGFYCSGQNKPNITIDGEGSLTIIGGSHCIYSNTPLGVGGNITLKTQQKDHWTSGIHAKSISVLDNAIISADLTSYLLESNDKENPENGSLIIGKNALITATITPCQDGSGGSTLSSISVITSSFSILFDKDSVVDVKVIFDSGNLGRGTYLPPVEVVSSNNDGDVALKPDAKVTISGKGDKMFGQDYILGFNGISSSNDLIIDNGTYSFVADLKYCYSIYGIVANNVECFSHSSINVLVTAYNVYAIACKGKFTCNLSSINIDVIGTDSENFVFGLVTYDELYINDNSNASIILSTKGIAMGVLLGTGQEMKTFDNAYLSSKILINTSKFLDVTVGYNYYSIPSVNGGYQYFEVPYDIGTSGEEHILNSFYLGVIY